MTDAIEGTTARGVRASRTTILMTIGMVCVGAAGFVVLAVGGNLLAPREAAALNSFYLIINILGPGLFIALEQETNRVVSGAQAVELSPRQGLRNLAMVAIGIVVLAVLVLGGLSPVLVDRVLAGHSELLLLLMLGAASAAMVYYRRGMLGGGRQFTSYAYSLMVEGLVRMLPCLVVALLGVATVGWYALFFAIGSGAAALAVRGRHPARGRRGRAQPDAAQQDAGQQDAAQHGAGSAAAARRKQRLPAVAAGIGYLGAATLLSQATANLAPVVVSARLVDQAAGMAQAFGAAFVLTRIPLLLFAPVQAVLLPSLTAAALRGELATVRRTMLRILAAVLVVGLPGAVASALLGPWIVETFFGAPVRVPGWIMGVLGLSTVLLMAAQVLQPALIALHHHGAVTAAWVVGTLVLVGILALPYAPIPVALVAQLVGPVLVVAGCLLALRHALAHGIRAGATVASG